MENPTPLRLKTGRVLGQGTFATVHKALHNSSVVAVKVLRPEYASNKEVVRMLLREAALVSSLTHPHIVRYRALCPVAVGTGPPMQALLMEHMESGSLADLLSKQMKQPGEHMYSDAEGLMWMLQIADALSYLHRREPAIIHRDVKPANVLLAPATATATAATMPGSGGGKASGRSLLLGGGSGGGGGKAGPRLVAKLCDFGLHQVVKPGDHRPLIRVSCTLARASSSGIFHNPRVSEDGSLLLPPSLMRTYERLRRPTAGALAAAAAAAAAQASAAAAQASASGLAAAAAAVADTDDDYGPMGQCPLRQLDSATQSYDGDSLGRDLMRRLVAPLGAAPPSLTLSSTFLEMHQLASPLPPSSSSQQQRRQSNASGGVAAAAAAAAAMAAAAAAASTRFTRTSSTGAAAELRLKAPAWLTATGMTPPPSPFMTTTATLGTSHGCMPEEEARPASLQAQRPRLILSPGPRTASRQQRGRPADDDDGAGLGVRQLEAGGTATAGGEVGGGGGAGCAARPHSRLQLCAVASERLAAAAAATTAMDVLGCAVPDAAAAAAFGQLPVAESTATIDSQGEQLNNGRSRQNSRANTVCGPLQFAHGADGSLAASLLGGRQAGGPPVPFGRTSTAPRDGGGAAAAAAAADGHGHVRCHLPIGHRRRSYSFGVSVGLGGGAVSARVPNAISADVGSEMPPLLERVFHFSGQCGSSIYMSPEVAQEQPYNEKADVFSFGVMLFEVVSRKLISRTQEGRDGYAFTRLMVEGRRPLLPPCLDPRVAALIGACWHSDPLERPSMQQVVAVLQDVLHGDHVAAATAAFRGGGVTLSGVASASFVGGGGGGGFKDDPSVTARYGSCAFAGAGASRPGGGGGGDTAATTGDSHSLRTYDNPLSLELSTSQARLLSLISSTTAIASSANNPTHALYAGAVDILSTSEVWSRNSPGNAAAAAAAAAAALRPATGGHRPQQQRAQQQQQQQQQRPATLQPPELLRSLITFTPSSPIGDHDASEPHCGPCEPSRLLSGRGIGPLAAATHGSVAGPLEPQVAVRDPGPGRAAAGPDRQAAAAAIVAAAAAAAARGAASAAAVVSVAAAAAAAPAVSPTDADLEARRASGGHPDDDDDDAAVRPATAQGADLEGGSGAAAVDGLGPLAPAGATPERAAMLLPPPPLPPVLGMVASPGVAASAPTSPAAAPLGSVAAVAAAAVAAAGSGLGHASAASRPSRSTAAVAAPRASPGRCSCCVIC